MQTGSLTRAGAGDLSDREGSAVMRALAAPVAIAAIGLAAMLIVASAEGLPLRDPDARYVGSPLALIALIVSLFLVVDLLPRAWRASRERRTPYFATLAAVFRERWWGRRGVVVVISILAFYGTYFAYRNLKSFM